MPASLTGQFNVQGKQALAGLQAWVGGYIEVVDLADGRQMVVNEEGWLKELPVNPEASRLAGQPIAGPAVILSGTARLT